MPGSSQIDKQTDKHCDYQCTDGTCCNNPVEKTGQCFWHDSTADKSSPDIREKLESYVTSGGYTKGLQLQGANLDGLNLVNHGQKQGYDISGSDFYRAKLRGAHFFNVTLENGSLMKADLREANLHFGHFAGTNLLGVKLEGSKIDHIEIGNKIRQEKLAHEADSRGERDKAVDLFEQAEEIYRALRKAAEEQGLFSLGGRFIHSELIMRRHCQPLLSFSRLKSKCIDLFCGYGERPGNVVIFSLALIVVCACIYSTLGLYFEGERLQLDFQNKTVVENLKGFFVSLYFSVVTFTTLGYGDVTPAGGSRPIAALEAFTGGFTMALFVVVFVKKMTR